MTEYIISFLKKRHSVFLLPADGKITDLINSDGLVLIPDSTSRADAVFKTVGRARYPKWQLYMLLGFFFRDCLGYPLCELSVEIDGELESLEIFDTPRGFTGIRLDKCKQMFTTFSDKVKCNRAAEGKLSHSGDVASALYSAVAECENCNGGTGTVEVGGVEFGITFRGGEYTVLTSASLLKKNIANKI